MGVTTSAGPLYLFYLQVHDTNIRSSSVKTDAKFKSWFEDKRFERYVLKGNQSELNLVVNILTSLGFKDNECWMKVNDKIELFTASEDKISATLPTIQQ